jgi:hypothetical protein
MAEQTQPVYSVQVTNISPNANEKTVSDFFSFCGKIAKLYLDKEPGKDTSKAVVQFETESAAKTALLLTNALIVDRPIVVTPYPPKDEPQQESKDAPGTPVPAERITHRDFGGVNDEERTKTSVLASMLASGYVLASDALAKAKEVDEEHNITLQLKVGVEQIKVKAHEIDQTYGISEKAVAVKQQAAEKAKSIDEQYKISEKASHAANVVKGTAWQASAKAQENPTIKQGVETAKSGWASVTQAVSGFYNDYKEQTVKAIEEKKKEQAAKQGKPVEEPNEKPQDLGQDAASEPQTVEIHGEEPQSVENLDEKK